jgi:hypothetical protein
MERALAFKKLSGGLAMPLDDTCPVLGWRIQTWKMKYQCGSGKVS